MKRLYPCFVALVSVAAAVTAAAAAALAADMPVAPATAYNPPPAYRPALYNWTGLYFGGHLGLGVMQDTVTATATTALQAAGTQTKLTPYGLLGGAQAGFNLEFAPFVVGAEGTWTDANVTGTQLTPSIPTPGSSERSTDFAHWYATAAGRIGFAANDLLIYAKGGAAWMNVGYTQANVAGGVIGTQTIYDTRKGYLIGGGLEYGLLENLSAKLEYDFLDFGTQNYSFNNLIGTPFPVAIKSVAHLISLGVNYRFNLGGGG